MAIPRILPAGLGALAILPTTAILVIHIILAHSLADPNPSSAVRVTAIVAAIFEAAVLVVISAIASSYLFSWPWLARLRSFGGMWFGIGLFLCTVAAALSVSHLVCLSNTHFEAPTTILGSKVPNFLVGSSVTLGLAFATQLVFLVFHFVASRFHNQEGRLSAETAEDGRRTPRYEVKSIAYHKTSPFGSKLRGSMSMESRSPPGSSAGRSVSDTMSSIRSSLSNVVHPITSKTKLLPGSQRSSRRLTGSGDSFHLNDQRPSAVEDGFDSWDTSAVDPQNRQTVLQTSPTPQARFLETIPASPTTSRSPSPGTPLDLEPPPRSRRRTRSFSPGPPQLGPTQQRGRLTQQPNHSESHIHPLFRSDSPTPPPTATPGTVVIAAPNGGQVLSDRASIRTLTRMRSGSLPTVPSPLSQQGSFDSFPRRPGTGSPELREEEEDELQVPVDGTERKMTPPIPDWILSAGSRTSFSGYTSRRAKTSHGEELHGRGPAMI
ncbi:hypothetical protein B0T16DRAFT_429151 [Cercophora newfieldiana]|uniref:Uncharacterized protein n=1 Tax=Cercophora newfieldiana TaxID=92897 RepID=A0AA40CR04_9PEZI|nr:hypothetical protein B0T16DRAFT_429151 [Cercophora newfieldiana]